MRGSVRKVLALSVVAFCAVAAGAPPEPARAPTPGSTDTQAKAGTAGAAPNESHPGLPQPKKDSGRKPGRPDPGRGAPPATGSARGPGAKSNPVGNVAVTVVVRPATEPETGPPPAFYLGQSHPNPFHVSTTIVFANPTRAPAQLVVFGLQGERVATLLDKTLDPGNYSVTWGGIGDDGRLLPPGVYLYRLRIGSRESIRKVAFSH